MTYRERVSFDLDGTICTEEKGKYALARPIKARVEEIQKRFAAGDYIIIDSARGSQTGVDWLDSTTLQLLEWGVPYHELHVGRKPFAHRYVDDRAERPDEFFAFNGHEERWPKSYFEGRNGTDPKRLTSFLHEFLFMVRHGVDVGGAVCDVGCSTGEFLDTLQWQGPRYGMEISNHAKQIAMTKGIRFDQHILNADEAFDVVIFRGTVQHIPEPFRYLDRAFKALKRGGELCVLATPNTDSFCYRVFKEFPGAIQDDARNYWMPSEKTLTNALRNFGFDIVATDTPYLQSGYARPLHDTLQFARKLLTGHSEPFSWPGNLMNVIARKP